jgi:hypothetical protein
MYAHNWANTLTHPQSCTGAIEVSDKSSHTDLLKNYGPSRGGTPSSGKFF